MMKVLNLQTFITRYIREASFRDEYQKNKERLYEELKLSDSEKKIINQLNVDLLDQTANLVLKERRDKRIADFEEFCSIMQQCNLFDDFFLDYVNTVTDGPLTPNVEAVRFYEFSKYYIEKNNLPPILNDLLEYSLRVFQVSSAPIESPNNKAPLDWDKKLFIKEPYQIKKFQYDISWALNNPSITSADDLYLTPRTQATFLIQKDYLDPANINVFEIDDTELFQLISHSFTANEILSQTKDEQKKNNRRETIIDCYDQDIIGNMES
jgi:hypothetical protein